MNCAHGAHVNCRSRGAIQSQSDHGAQVYLKCNSPGISPGISLASVLIALLATPWALKELKLLVAHVKSCFSTGSTYEAFDVLDSTANVLQDKGLESNERYVVNRHPESALTVLRTIAGRARPQCSRTIVITQPFSVRNIIIIITMPSSVVHGIHHCSVLYYHLLLCQPLRPLRTPNSEPSQPSRSGQARKAGREQAARQAGQAREAARQAESKPPALGRSGQAGRRRASRQPGRQAGEARQAGRRRASRQPGRSGQAGRRRASRQPGRSGQASAAMGGCEF